MVTELLTVSLCVCQTQIVCSLDYKHLLDPEKCFVETPEKHTVSTKCLYCLLEIQLIAMQYYLGSGTAQLAQLLAVAQTQLRQAALSLLVSEFFIAPHSSILSQQAPSTIIRSLYIKFQFCKSGQCQMLLASQARQKKNGTAGPGKPRTGRSSPRVRPMKLFFSLYLA